VRIGEILAGKYRVERILGVGAMGVVVAATHVDLLELRAIKFMLPSMLGDAEGVERFLREARAVSKLRSRHVATVYDVGRLETGAPYIVMEHLEGADLKTVLDQRRTLAPAEAAAYVSEACEALSEAHAAGIIHRDIKPANLFLATRAGGPPAIKVLDFGIAKMAAGAGSAAMEVTRTKEILGTPLYMSPEQMRSMRSTDARSDVWSLGVILYRALTGKVPFDGESLTEVCIAVLGDTPVRPSALRPDLPAGLEAVILGCLEKDPARRIGSAAELAMALAPFVASTARALQDSLTSSRLIVNLTAPSVVGESTEAATLVWKPSPPEGREQSSRATWAQTGNRTDSIPRRRLMLGAMGLASVAVVVGLAAGWRALTRSSSPTAQTAGEFSAPLSPSASASASIEAAPIMAPAPTGLAAAPSVAPTVKDPPAPSASALVKTSKAPKPAPHSPAPPKSPGGAPPAPAGDIFGSGRY
jgi:serine/threonine protein kinase